MFKISKNLTNIHNVHKIIIKKNKFLIKSTRPFSISPQKCLSDKNSVIKSTYSDVNIPDQSLTEYLFENVSKYADRSAITCGQSGRTYRYGTLYAMMKRMGNAYLSPDGCKLQKNDTIGALLPNIPEFLPAIYGALDAGLKVTFANPLYTPEEIIRQFQMANVKMVITIPPFLPLSGAFKKSLPNYQGTLTIGGGGGGGASGDDSIYDFQSLVTTSYKPNNSSETIKTNDVAIIPFSSGTSGLPKGVQLTHRNCISNLQQLCHPAFSKYSNENYNVESGEIVFSIPPFFHIYGFNGILNLTFKCRSHLITLPKFTPEDYIKTLIKYRPQILFVVPSLLQFLASHPSVSAETLASVDQVIVGAAPASFQIQEKFRQKCNRNVQILQGYGMTESSPVSLLTPLEALPGKTASVGKLFPNTEARIVDLDTGRSCQPNERGELQIRGPQVMLGYLNNKAATKEAIDSDGGWLRTGDVALIDDDDYFFIVDRTKELIKVKGNQVSPTELENLINEFPQVADVAVGGVVQEDSDELPRAYVVLRPETKLTGEEIIKHVESKAAKFKWLTGGVKFVTAIPRNTSGKTLRRELLKL